MSSPAQPISISRLADSLSIAWDARDVVTANGSVFRLIRVEGTMEWHHHEEDQLFVCWDGTFTVELEASPAVELKRGDVFVVPRGTEHKTHANGLAHALMSIGVHTMARP
jgi:quercetin dioxygenase-like cupin family protein